MTLTLKAWELGDPETLAPRPPKRINAPLAPRGPSWGPQDEFSPCCAICIWHLHVRLGAPPQCPCGLDGTAPSPLEFRERLRGERVAQTHPHPARSSESGDGVWPAQSPAPAKLRCTRCFCETWCPASGLGRLRTATGTRQARGLASERMDKGHVPWPCGAAKLEVTRPGRIPLERERLGQAMYPHGGGAESAPQRSTKQPAWGAHGSEVETSVAAGSRAEPCLGYG